MYFVLYKLFSLVLLAGLLFPIGALAAAGPFSLAVSSSEVIQGEPLLVTLIGVISTTSVRSLLFGTTPVKIFLYHGSAAALVGVDLNKKSGTYNVAATLTDGSVLMQPVVVKERPRITVPLGIPAKLGGNTAASQQALVSTLASENASLATIKTGTKAFWSAAFRWPLADTTVTDAYGYTRETGAYTIAHKGTDFRAEEGAAVLAINRGVVRIAKTYRNYGKTIVVDHGLGLMSFYMHLSKINVAVGQLVLPGQVVGLSGKTGYAESPHLHLTIRINGTSIDPIKFFALFGVVQ